MNTMNFMVRGAIFAWFPHYNQSDPRGREMVEQTVQRLKQLDAERPEVVLIPEPENPKDPKAVRVYCQGNPVGYVAHEQADKAQWLFDAMHPIVPARITRVEAESELRFYIEADLPEGVLPEPTLTAEASDAWSDWQCSIPKLPMPEVWKSCQVLEVQIERKFPVLTLEQVKNLRTFIRQWIEKSLHDFSVEAMQLRVPRLLWCGRQCECLREAHPGAEPQPQRQGIFRGHDIQRPVQQRVPEEARRQVDGRPCPGVGQGADGGVGE